MFFKRKLLPEKPTLFGVITGASGLPKNIGVSGDSYMCRRLPGARFAVAVADGMGTGARAGAMSRRALEPVLRNAAVLHWTAFIICSGSAWITIRFCEVSTKPSPSTLRRKAFPPWI